MQPKNQLLPSSKSLPQKPLSKPADKFAKSFLSITKVTELAEIPKIIRQIEHRCNNKVHIGILYKST